MTGTFKHKKGPLRDQGFDPRLCGEEDLLLFRDDTKQTFVDIDSKLFNDICKGNVRL